MQGLDRDEFDCDGHLPVGRGASAGVMTRSGWSLTAGERCDLTISATRLSIREDCGWKMPSGEGDLIVGGFSRGKTDLVGPLHREPRNLRCGT